MVDQPGVGTSRSYKIPGHTRQRRTTKPYARPGEVKKKGLLDTVKDYLRPSWLFGYFKANEPEPEESLESEEDSDNEDSDDEDSPLNVQRSSHGSSSTRKETPNRSSIDEGNTVIVAGNATNAVTPSSVLTEKERVSDMIYLHPSTFSENNNKGETCKQEGMTVRLSGVVDSEREDDLDVVNISDENVKESKEPAHSLLSYSAQQLKRRPLPSILHSRTITSSLFQSQRMPTVHSEGTSLQSLLSSTRAATTSSQAPTAVLSRMNTTTTNVVTSLDNWRGSQPVASVTSTPGFSVSTFVTPVPRSFTKKRTESPFYPGRVTYGGASSISGYTSGKRLRRNSPGSEICQPVRKQQIRAKPLPMAIHGGPTTQTAQRILEALESVSSPLKDVRRIPSPLKSSSASPLSFSASKLRKKPPRPNIGPRVSSLQAKLLGGPPVEALSTPQVAKVTGVDLTEPPLPKTSSTPFTTSDDSPLTQPADRSLFSGLKDTVLKTSLPTVFIPKALPTSLSPVEKTLKTSGKMRSAPRGATHYSSKNSGKDEQVVNPLPEIELAVPLPLNTSKNLPSLSVGVATNAESNNTLQALERNNNKTLEELPIIDKIAAETCKNGFIFSTPKPKPQISSVKEALTMADDEVSFSFSRPVSVKSLDKKDIKTDLLKDIANNSPFTSTASSFGFKTDADQSTSSKEVAKSSGVTSGETMTTHNSLAVMFGAAPGEWDSSTCMVRNKASEENCIACGTAGASKTSSEKNASKDKERASNVENSTTSIAKQFAPAKGSWSCGTCMIINQADTSKCVACDAGKPETGKSGSLESGSQNEQSSDLKRRFAAPANTWECEVCMIRNTQGQVKCAACDAKRPGCMTTENDLKVRFAAPAGSWDCETCMITNQPSAVKCVACQTSKPGSESKAGSGEPGFGFGSSTLGVSGGDSSTVTSGFTFGSDVVTTSTASSFTFGKTDQVPAKSGFTFGSSAAEVKTTKPDFTFGVSCAGECSTVPKFSFGSGGSLKDSKGSGFTFGMTGSDKKSTSVQDDCVNKDQSKDVSTGQEEDFAKIEKVESPGPLNIAQAAAAGLLKVPRISVTTSSSKQVSRSPSPSKREPSTPSITVASRTLPATNGDTPFVPGPKNVPVTSVALLTSLTTPKTTTDSPKFTPFNFGTNALPSAESSSTSATTSQLAILSKSGGNTGLNFGAVSTSKPEAQTFNFTTQSTASADEKDGKPSFNFIASAYTSKETSGPVFKFVAPVPSTGETKNALLSNTTSVSTVPAKKNALPDLFTSSGGSTSENNPKLPVFNFGSMNGPSTNGGSNTGQSQATQSGSSLFNFTAGQTPSTDTENQNSLGGEDMDADSTSNHGNGQPAFGTPGGFTFAAQAPANASAIFGAGSSGTSGNSTGGFNFGSGGSATPQGFQFGTPNNTNHNSTTSGGFNFGAGTAAGAAGAHPFVFAGAANNTGNPPANPPAPSGGFSFTASAANTSTPSFNFSQGPVAGTPFGFNIGAAENPPSTRVFKKAVRRTRR